MTIQCPKCGTNNDDESIYCGSCGTLLSSSEASPPALESPYPITASPPVPRRRIPKRTRNIVIAVDVAIIIVVIAVALATAKPAAPAASQTLNVVNGSLTIGQSSSSYIQFTVPTGATRAEVEGNFTVTTPRGSAIQVYVMDNVNLFIWINTHGNGDYVAYYKSGLVTSGTIDTRLAPGTYYLIFDNVSSASPKDVQADVSLAYS